MSINQTRHNPQPKTIKNAVESGFALADNGSSLGTTTGLASTRTNIDVQDTTQQKQQSNAVRYKLQNYAQELHPASRLSACLKVMTHDTDFVDVHYNADDHHAHYQGLAHCDNVWGCPVCSGRISSQRAEEIRQAYSYAIDEKKMRIVMVTYTLSHHKFDSLQDLVDAIRSARKKMRSGRSWQNFKANYGYVGAIASFEVTHGEDNGWHPHVHEIMVLDPEQAEYDIDPTTSDEILQKWLTDELSPEWIKSLAKVDRTASSERGLDVRTTSQYVGEYIAKYGKLPNDLTWDIALEIAKNNRKSDSQGLHPFSMLAKAFDKDLSVAERNKYRALWYEYMATFKGQKQIFWTKGLKDLLLVPDALDETEKESFVVVKLQDYMWSWVCKNRLRAELLNQVLRCRGDSGIVNAWLKSERAKRRLLDKMKV
jgi:hypothetical protein